MKNLKIQYAPHVPEIDFSSFVEGESFGVKTQRLIKAAKGELIFHKHVSRMECAEAVEKAAMEYVGPFLRNWNGWTWRWYVDEFMKRVGINN